ncbi:TetR/AcrR family transcriptional regulator [Herbiconiux liukaitaii]|uniref:TetR/AcrR family transcriptional regulator n=1 Tax=Herbiconiux liukaitaii TaxID=3342799 RepID=UPI0035B6D75A
MTVAPKENRGPSAGPANRRALVAAAREIFTDTGLHAPLSAVAKRAGVGQGSLYRHFPDRMSLAVAVFDENIEQLERVAEAPESTLDDLLARVTEQALVSKALIELVTADPEDERVAHLGTRVQAVVDLLVERDKAAGRIGPQVAGADVMLAISMLAGVLGRTPQADRAEVARRAWSLFHAAFRGA